LPSHNAPQEQPGRWLRRKEFRELAHSPAFAILLVLTSVLVGHEFISAVKTYSEMSGPGADALARGMNPLDGILVPTFGAYDIVATLLLPFVVIRLFAGERATGAWTLLVQSPSSVGSMVAAKVFALCVAWLVALVPGFIAVALWQSYGGHVYPPELGALVLGHLIRAALTIALAAAAAAVTRQAATAAIVTLGVTIGSWALDFTAATRGGWWARVAAFTPSAALRLFEQGLVRADTMWITLGIAAAGCVIASYWLAPGTTVHARVVRSIRLALFFLLFVGATLSMHRSWDVTEDRRHSFSEADEAKLDALPSPLKIEIHLGAEDPRLADFRREILEKLQREVPRISVSYSGVSGTGLFASADPHYGEIWYEIGGKRVMLKSAIEPVVLGAIYALAGIHAEPAAESESYRGYPRRTDAPMAWILFFVIYPAIVLTAFWRLRKS
jgi:ABC-2 type transport system permease protein